jgi:hypothetical protein
MAVAGILVCANVLSMAILPSSVAEKPESAPRNPPIGVLLAETINTSFIILYFIPIGIFYFTFMPVVD